MTDGFDVELPPFKVVVVGDAGVGKTSLLQRLVYNRFADTTAATIGVDFIDKEVVLDGGGTVRLQLWDTAGQERYNALSTNYMRNAAAVMYVYDCDSVRSLETIGRWVRSTEQQHGRAPVRFLVGSKSDLEGSERTEARALEVAAQHEMQRDARCSAKTGAEISETFRALATMLRYAAVEQALEDAERRQQATIGHDDMMRAARSTALDVRSACQC